MASKFCVNENIQALAITVQLTLGVPALSGERTAAMPTHAADKTQGGHL